MSTDEAIAHGIKTTAGVVTSAAIVMVGVFAIFGDAAGDDLQAVRRRARGGDPDRRDDHPRDPPAGVDEAARRLELVPAEVARVDSAPRARAARSSPQGRGSAGPRRRRPRGCGTAAAAVRPSLTQIRSSSQEGLPRPQSRGEPGAAPSAGLARVARSASSRLHVVDDNFLQPNPGTSAADHLASGLVPTRAARSAPAFCTRACAPASRAALALLFGVLRPPRRHRGRSTTRAQVGPSGDDYTGLLVDPGRPRPARRRRCDAVAVAAHGRPPLVAVPPPAAAGRAARIRRGRSSFCSRSRSRTSSRTSARAEVPPAEPRRRLRGRGVHDERRADV